MNEIIYIEKMIDKYNLKNNSRRRSLVCKRYYLMYELRRFKMPLQKIGKLFDRNHATVIHGIRMHKRWSKQQDLEYLYEIEQLKADLYQDNFIPKIKVRAIEQINDVKLSIYLPNDRIYMHQVSEFMTADEVYELIKS